LYSGYGINVDFAYNRKEVKDHGEGGQLVGASMAQRRVLIIDDVITAGTAIRESYDLLTSVSAIPMGVVIALDRAEIRSLEDRISAVQAVERDFSIPVVSIVNLVELQSFLEQSKDYDKDTLQSVVSYRKEYGAM
jgi:orotate phosphoribosyltransferase